MLWMVPQYSEFKAVGAVDPEGLFIIVSQDCPLKKKIFLHLPFPVSRMIFSYFSRILNVFHVVFCSLSGIKKKSFALIFLFVLEV